MKMKFATTSPTLDAMAAMDATGMPSPEADLPHGINAAGTTGKKAYAQPRLTRHGRVSQLTAGPGGSGTDGFSGSFG